MGFAAAHGILRSRYEQQAQDEIDSVKVRFRKREKELKTDTSAHGKEAEHGAEVSSYRSVLKDAGYGQAQDKPGMPRVISPNDFGEADEYDQISLTYYSDGTLANDHDRPMNVDDILQTVGTEWKRMLDNPDRDDDAVYVRNDGLKVDYEILWDERTYAQVLKEKPYLAN